MKAVVIGACKWCFTSIGRVGSFLHNQLHNNSVFVASSTAIIGVIISLVQISSASRSEAELKRKELAYSAYRNFLELSIKYSEFSCVDDNKKLDYLRNTIDNNSPIGDKLIVRYNLYRRMTMIAMEEILMAQPHSADWKKSVKLRLECHKAYLASPDFVAKPDEKYKGWKCVTRNMIYEIVKNPIILCTKPELEEDAQNSDVF